MPPSSEDVKLTENMRGQALYRDLVQALLLTDVDELFSGAVTQTDLAELRRLATFTHGLTTNLTLAEEAGSHIARGHWKALEAHLEGRTGSKGTNVADAAILLYLPACHVDVFTVCVLFDADARKAMATERPSGIPAWVDKLSAENATLQKLHSYAAASILNWLNDMRFFDFGLERPKSRRRVERFARSLDLIVQNPTAYTETIAVARTRDWKRANAIAARTLAETTQAVEVDWPPALADFLLTAFVPPCQLSSLRQSLAEFA